MTIWSAEMRELTLLYEALKGKLPDLEKELERLVKTDDENMVLVYSRRCLEVIITDLCEGELKRPRGTEPLKGIIDKLNKEEMVPSHIITSMGNLNSLSTYGAHPKEFDLHQVRPVLLDLSTIIKWYLNYKNLEVKIKKVKPEHETLPDETLPKAALRFRRPLILISGIVIVGFFALMAVKVFSLFSKDKFGAIREEDGRISVAVMPFENQTGDTTLNWFQRGISSLITNGLGSSSELAVRDDQTMYEVMESIDRVFTAGISGSQAKEVAQKVNAEAYISGSYQGREGVYWIMVNLVDTESGDILWTHRVEGDLKSSEYLELGYTLCNEIKDHLEIKALEQDANYDFRVAYTESAEAYRHFIEGMNSVLCLDYVSGIPFLESALEIDSTFTLAAFYTAYAYGYYYEDELRNHWTQKAYDLKEQLPVKYRHWLELWYACYISKNLPDIIRYCNLLEETGIESRLMWFDLGVTYYDFAHNYAKAVKAFEEVEKINLERGDEWDYELYYEWYGKALREIGNQEKEKEILEKGLIIYPGSYNISIQQAILNLSRGNENEAEADLHRLDSIMKEVGYSEVGIELVFGLVHYYADVLETAEAHFKKAYVLAPQNPNALYWLSDLLINQDMDVDEGMQLIRKATALYPDNPGFIGLKGWGLYKQGKPEEGLELLKMAEEKSLSFDYDLHQKIREVEQAVAR